MRWRAAIVCAALLGLTSCGDLASNPTPAPDVVRAAPAQRVEHVAWSAADLAQLRSTVRSALDSHYFAHAGIAIADESGTILYGSNVARGYAPASTFKTLVAAAALATLGVDARLDTSLDSLDRPDPSGRVDELWLRGNGDPVLDPKELRAGIAALSRSGVRRIEGDVILDAPSFGEREQNAAWAADDFENGYAAGTSALSLNWNVIEFKIAPTRVGVPARVTVYPANPQIVIHGAPVTGYQTNLSIDRLAPGRNEFTIEGSIANLGELSFFRPVLGIPLWTAQVVAQMLREQGIAFSGQARVGGAPLALQTLWVHRSPPLQTMVKQMLFESDNHIAEQLLRVLGTESGDGVADSSAENAGAAVERTFLRSLEVPIPGLRIVDASGLAESNRVAPITLVRLLQAMLHTPVEHAYVSAFPRAGVEGTVRHHDLSAAYGRVRAKSGHIDGVNALAGYLDTRHHGRLAFAFLVNEPYADDATSIRVGIDRALDGLATL